MEFNKNNRLNFVISFLFGSLIIIYIFYIRIIFKRLPKEMFMYFYTDTQIVYNYPIIYFVIFSIIFSIAILIISFKNIYYPDKETKIPFIITKIIKIILDFITKSLFTVYLFFINKIDNSYAFFSAIIMKFYFITESKKHYIFVFEYIIRCVILIALFVDTFVFFKFKFFYHSLILLIIPLIIQIWFFTLKEFSRAIDFFEQRLSITYKEKDSPNQVISYKISRQFENQKLDLMYHLKEYRNCASIKEYLEEFNFERAHYNLRFNVIYYILYLINFIYIFAINIFYYFS